MKITILAATFCTLFLTAASADDEIAARNIEQAAKQFNPCPTCRVQFPDGLDPCTTCRTPDFRACAPLPDCCEEEEQEIIIECLNSITLVDDAKTIRCILQCGDEELSSINTVNLCLPGSIEPLQIALSNFIDKPLRKCDLTQIKRAIILYYRDHHHPLVTVRIPEQDVTDGCLILIVKESTLDKVTVCGHKYFSAKRYWNAIKLNEGETIDESQLLNNLNSINRNPFRRADLLYTPGSCPDTTTIEIVAKDRFPLSAYAGSDNNGLEDINLYRFFGGATWGNVFGLDQMFTVQYSCAPNPHTFYAVSGFYEIPLPNQNHIVLWGGYSHVHADGPSHTKADGQSGQASMRYEIPLCPTPKILQEIFIGYDYKRMNNTVEFETDPMIGQFCNLTQFVFGYNVGYEDKGIKVGFDIQLFTSPFTWLTDQSRKAYATLIPDARPIYTYGRSSLDLKFELPWHFEFVAEIAGQFSSTPLIPSEQLGIGGFSTVRGYVERQLNADRGFFVRSELCTPKTGVFAHLCRSRVQDLIELYAFLDYGFSRDIHKEPHEKQIDYLLGAGPGLRYSLNRHLTARVEWGIKLHRAKRFEAGNSIVHFSVITSF